MKQRQQQQKNRSVPRRKQASQFDVTDSLNNGRLYRVDGIIYRIYLGTVVNVNPRDSIPTRSSDSIWSQRSSMEVY